MIRETDNSYELVSSVFKDELGGNKILSPFNKTIVYDSFGFLNFDLIYDRIEINYLYIKEEYRGKGYASELIKYLLNYDILNITLEVRVDNISAINLYKKNGFKIVKTINNYYGEKDGYLMIMEVKE